MYAVPLDLIAHANRARLIGQLAGNDYGEIPTAETVVAYFQSGTTTPATADALDNISERCEQAINNAAGEINGALALAEATLPDETKHTACVDLALFRLFENLADDSIIRINAKYWRDRFDQMIEKKKSNNANSDDVIATGSAETIGSDMVFTADKLEGY